jgi:hypothetical protein
VGLLLGCLPHHQRWVVAPRSGLAAWYVRWEKRTITYAAKGAHGMSRLPNLSKGEMCSNYYLSICPKFLQPFSALPEGWAPQVLRSRISSSGTSCGPVVDVFTLMVGAPGP